MEVSKEIEEELSKEVHNLLDNSPDVVFMEVLEMKKDLWLYKNRAKEIFRIEGIINRDDGEQVFVQYSHSYATKDLAETRIADLKTVYHNANFWVVKENVINSYQ